MTTDEMEIEDTLEIPDFDSFIENKRYPDDNDVPDGIKPKRRRRPRKRERETIETITQTLTMLNSMFAAIVPCSCEARLPEELRGTGAHIENCSKLFPLTEDESNALSAAISAEFEAHPEWMDKLENADKWMAHAMLITTTFSIVMSRRMRSPSRVLLPENATPEMISAVNGAHADAV